MLQEEVTNADMCEIISKNRTQMSHCAAYVRLFVEQTGGSKMLREEVTEADISDIISKWTGIPVSKLAASERDKLLHLADELHQRVIGQDEAVVAVADAIQR